MLIEEKETLVACQEKTWELEREKLLDEMNENEKRERREREREREKRKDEKDKEEREGRKKREEMRRIQSELERTLEVVHQLTLDKHRLEDEREMIRVERIEKNGKDRAEEEKKEKEQEKIRIREKEREKRIFEERMNKEKDLWERRVREVEREREKEVAARVVLEEVSCLGCCFGWLFCVVLLLATCADVCLFFAVVCCCCLFCFLGTGVRTIKKFNSTTNRNNGGASRRVTTCFRKRKSCTKGADKC